MIQNKKVVQQCPRCSKTYKVLRLCSSCFKKACVECSYKSLCIDCYVNKSSQKEIKIYNMLKNDLKSASSEHRFVLRVL